MQQIVGFGAAREPGRLLPAIDDFEQFGFVVTDDWFGAETAHQLQHAEVVGAAVDGVAERDQAMAIRVIVRGAQQPFEGLAATLDVSDEEDVVMAGVRHVRADLSLWRPVSLSGRFA